MNYQLFSNITRFNGNKTYLKTKHITLLMRNYKEANIIWESFINKYGAENKQTTTVMLDVQ